MSSSKDSASRQQLLILYLASPDLASRTIGFTLYDGAGEESSMTGDTDTPPYASAVAAMRDGWRVIQMAQPTAAERGAEYETSYLRWEIVLERMVEAAR
jgi:hypothetical protein